MRSASIRLRLTIWYSGVLALLVTAFGSAVFFTMQHQLLGRVDLGLREELSDVLSEVERAETRTGMLQWLDRRFGKHQGFDFQVTTEDGNPIYTNDRLEESMPIPAQLQPPPLVGGASVPVFASHQRTAHSRWRIVSQKVPGPEGLLVVQVARSLKSYDEELGELLLVLLVTGLLTLLVAWAGGYFLARRALAPVDRMTDSANRIEANRLDQRLEVSNPHDELGRLAGTLNRMLDRLETSFREMQRFTADASHELRTPISVIRTEAEVALGRSTTDHEQRQLLGSILEECQRLGWLTDQLLALSREDAGIAQFRSAPVDLGHLAGQVAEAMRPLADERDVELAAELEPGVIVPGDPNRLKQVVYNLLDNAIKFSPVGGRVELVVASGVEATTFIVRDSGVGIAPEQLPHVFERFYRADKARSRNGGGTGLGLSIVQSIVSAHGGSVSIQSQPASGTEVCVTLPCPDRANYQLALQSAGGSG